MQSARLFFTKTSATTYYTYTNAGNNGPWTVAGTWTTDPSGTSLVGSAIPGNNDVVHILNGFTVFLTANVSTTGLTININNGGTLDLATFTLATISNLSGSGTLKINAGYFPTITANNFTANSAAGATVEYYDFSGSLPVAINYPNLILSNSTGTDHEVAFSNATAHTFTVFGNLTTLTTGLGDLTVRLGTQSSNLVTLNINRNLIVGSNTTFGVGAFDRIHNINILGNLTNDGLVQMSNGGQYVASTSGAAHVTFTGATHNSLACNGITNFYTLTVNKGLNDDNILSVTSTNTANLTSILRSADNDH